MTRRGFLSVMMQAVASAGCATPVGPGGDIRGRLTQRPHTPMNTIGPGEHRLGLASDRDGVLFVPHSYRPDTAAPLALMLHGAGGTGGAMRFTYDRAEVLGIVVLAPDSRDPRTWDVILGGFGPDVEYIDRALEHVFDRCLIDPERLAIGGFSDGASYALSIGLGSGDLFTDICAFSPGFAAPAAHRGRPAVFISHGVADTVLPIDRTSRRLVPDLRSRGYEVTYREFQGGHEVPAGQVREAFESLAQR